MTALGRLRRRFIRLGLLASLSPDLIKLDRHLVTKAALHKNHAAVVRGLVHIARECGQLILAKHRNEAELITMQELGIDYFKAFYWPVPLPSHRSNFGSDQ